MKQRRRMIPCHRCTYYRETTAQAWGECHRHAPRPKLATTAGAGFDVFWPPVPYDEACGDAEEAVIHNFGGHPGAIPMKEDA